MNVIAICLPLLLLSPLATLQEGERPTFTPPKAAGTPSAGAASALKPGVLPKDATPKAVELWKRACAAALAPGAERTRVEGFQLSFDILTRSSAGPGSNETRAEFLYLDPQRYVRTSLTTGREHVMGPEGPFLINGDQKIRLRQRREDEADLRQIAETQSIARNFLALTDPGSLRIASLAEGATPPPGLPPELEARARQLHWLDARSPDFQLVRTGERAGGDRLYRVRLGLDPASGRVEQAVVGDDAGPLRAARLLVTLHDASPLDGYLVPGHLLVHQTAPASRGRLFEELPNMELYRVPPGTLRPQLGPEDFKP